MTDRLVCALGGQLFGIAATDIRHVMPYDFALLPVPLAGETIAGSFNWRGQIVTILHLHHYLDIPAHLGFTVVVSHHETLYGLAMDTVMDVVSFPDAACEAMPAGQTHRLEKITCGVFAHKAREVAALDLNSLLHSIAEDDDETNLPDR